MWGITAGQVLQLALALIGGEGVATHCRQSQQQLHAFLKISASLKQLTS